MLVACVQYSGRDNAFWLLPFVSYSYGGNDTVRVGFTFVRESSLRVGTALPPRAGYCAGATQHRPVRRGVAGRKYFKPPVGEKSKDRKRSTDEHCDCQSLSHKQTIAIKHTHAKCGTV